MQGDPRRYCPSGVSPTIGCNVHVFGVATSMAGGSIGSLLIRSNCWASLCYMANSRRIYSSGIAREGSKPYVWKVASLWGGSSHFPSHLESFWAGEQNRRKRQTLEGRVRGCLRVLGRLPVFRFCIPSSYTSDVQPFLAWGNQEVLISSYRIAVDSVRPAYGQTSCLISCGTSCLLTCLIVNQVPRMTNKIPR